MQCSYCQADVPLSSTYEPFPGNATIRRCRDTGACQRRQLHAGTGVPEGPPAWETARAAISPPSPCGICHAADPPGGLFERTPDVWFCRDRAGCEQRSVEVQFLTAHREDFADPEITVAEMRHAISAAGAAPVVAERPGPASDESVAVNRHEQALAAVSVRKRARR